MRNSVKRQTGITLIALVVSIIVLIILAGVSIAMLVGENGIITQAQKADKLTTQAQQKEAIELAVASVQAQGTLELDKTKLETALQSQLGDTSYTLTENEDGSYLLQIAERSYYIDSTGEVITEENMIAIGSAEELKAFRDDINSGNSYEGKYIYLTGNITLNSSEQWEPIGLYPNDSTTPDDENNKPFRGIFDGKGYEVNGIYINTTDKVQGLFGLVNGGKILNLGIGNNCNITGGNSTGVIVGYLYTGIIYNCNNNSSITGNNTVGGVVGQIYNGTIENSYNLAKVSGNEAIGGIVGGLYNNSSMKRCYNNGEVIGKENVGGISGIVHTNTDLEECYNTGNVNGNESSGGIVGYISNSVLEKCYNIGNIICDQIAGGIAGKNEAKISLCYNIGEIEGTAKIGGIAGQNSNTTGIIKNAYSLEGRCEQIVGESLNHSKEELCEIKTEQEMKALASTLGDAFKEDTSNINNGYPILTWQ